MARLFLRADDPQFQQPKGKDSLPVHQVLTGYKEAQIFFKDRIGSDFYGKRGRNVQKM